MTFAFYRQRLQSKEESISEIFLTTKVKPDGVGLQNMMEETLREHSY